MDKLFGGISIITIVGVIYKLMNLFLAEKTDAIFFTAIKKYTMYFINFFLILNFYSTSLFILPLGFEHKNLPSSFLMSLVGNILFVVTLLIIISNVASISKLTKLKRLSKFLYNDLTLAFILIIYGLYGLLVMLKYQEFTNDLYKNYAGAFFTSLIWSFLSSCMINVYLNNYRRLVREVCWFEYQENNGGKEKYFIYHASSDSEHVVCGKNATYDENQEFKFFKIKELKEKYSIHFEKNKIVKCNINLGRNKK